MPLRTMTFLFGRWSLGYVASLIVAMTVSSVAQAQPTHLDAWDVGFSDGRGSVWTSREIYAPNETITAHFAGLPGNDGDWVTIVPRDLPIDEYRQWFWTDAQVSGSRSFSGLAEGEYQVRVYYNWPDDGYQLRLVYAFVVADRSRAPAIDGEASVRTNKGRYEPNEPIKVEFRGLPTTGGRNWVTIVPEAATATEYGQWQWTSGSGAVDFDGVPAGHYEARVYYDWPHSGYRIRLAAPFLVSARPVENLSDAIVIPEYWDGWDTVAATGDIIDEITQDKPAEALLMLTMDSINEQLVRERNAEKLARLEAAYKRKLLRFMQSTFGAFKSTKLPPITIKEIELLTEAYRYSPTVAQRVSQLAETWAGLKRFVGEGPAAYLRKRLGRAVTAKLFSRVFGPVSTAHDIYTIYQFVKETEEVRGAWEGALASMEQMNCLDYELSYFRSNLSAAAIEQIEALRTREAAYFRSQGLDPPTYPPWQHEINAACGR